MTSELLTHKGWLGLCPVYLGNLDSDGPLVEPRHWTLGWLLSLSLWLYDSAAFVPSATDPTFVPHWPIYVSGKLATPRALND